MLLLFACTGTPPADTDTDPETDADTDSDTDADTDADTDTDLDPWGWCPPATDAVTTGTSRMSVGENAIYCMAGNGASLEEELALKMKIRFTPGEYPVPYDTGSYTYALPACLLGADQTVPSAMTGTGTLDMSAERTYDAWALHDQPIERDGATWNLYFSILSYRLDEESYPLRFDGALNYGAYGEVTSYLQICDGECDGDTGRFAECTPYEYDTEPSLSFTFDRGEFHIYSELAWGSLGPSATEVFWRAEGTLDGTPFEQESYWNLAFVADHHNRGGGALVRFDTPIGGACGLLAEAPSEDGSFRFDRLRVATIECDGTVIEELEGAAYEEAPRGG